MQAIYKYEIDTIWEQIINLPKDSLILCVQVQEGKPCLWCRIDTENIVVARKIRIFATGQPIELGFEGNYIGTYQLFQGREIYHVFDCN